jgi:pimeloyl-ACP methyl ester carboxylesterase
MDALHLEAAVIAGGSSGSSVARCFATDHPERTLELVLIGSPATLRDKPSVLEVWDSAVSELTDPADPAGAAREECRMTANSKKDAVLVRSAWITLIVVGAIFGLFGLSDVILGMNADPAIAESITGVAWEDLQASNPQVANLIDMYVRSLGAGILVVSILSLAITLTAFKRGERWAWFALWVWPLWNVAIFVLSFTAERHPGYPPPPPMVSSPVFFSVTLLALILSYRKFFPKA